MNIAFTRHQPHLEAGGGGGDALFMYGPNLGLHESVDLRELVLPAGQRVGDGGDVEACLRLLNERTKAAQQQLLLGLLGGLDDDGGAAARAPGGSYPGGGGRLRVLLGQDRPFIAAASAAAPAEISRTVFFF